MQSIQLVTLPMQMCVKLLKEPKLAGAEESGEEEEGEEEGKQGGP